MLPLDNSRVNKVTGQWDTFRGRNSTLGAA